MQQDRQPGERDVSRGARSSSPRQRLVAGARVTVERRSPLRQRGDPGFVKRYGTVVRVHDSVAAETRVYVVLEAGWHHDRSREWLWASEVRVT